MAGTIENTYFACPIWMQQTLVAVYGWWWYRRRFGPDFHRFVAELQERETWGLEQFHTYQEQQLEKVLAAAWQSPYYHEVFREVGITPEMKPFETLSQLPFLTKETLRRRARDLSTVKQLPRDTLILKSSGTTGTPTEIYYTQAFHTFMRAMMEVRNLHWAQVNYRDRRVMFGVRKVCHFDQKRPPFWRFSPIENMAYASIYHLSRHFLSAYIDFLHSYQPAIIMGYPSAISTIAHYALTTNHLPPPAKAIITTSETVTERTREMMESVWKCRVFDQYGAVENCLFAAQCEYGRYHVSPDVGIIEIVDHDGQPVAPGVMGQVICTGLVNRLQPLIRYQIGDVARWSTKQDCPCGSHMPILESIEGRYEDICYTPDGREMLRFDTVFKGVETIKEAQVVQEKIATFIIYVVPDEGFSEHDIEQLKKNMQLHAGNVSVLVQPVDFIPRTASGKFRAVVCNLSPEEREMVARERTTG